MQMIMKIKWKKQFNFSHFIFTWNHIEQQNAIFHRKLNLFMNHQKKKFSFVLINEQKLSRIIFYAFKATLKVIWFVTILTFF